MSDIDLHSGTRSKLVLALRRILWVSTNPNHCLTPRLSIGQILQTLRNALKTLVDVLKDGRCDLLSLEHVEKSLPCLADLVGLVADVSTPVDTSDSNVLEENKVGGNLFDGACCKADDDDATVPGDDFQRRDDHSDWVVDYVYSVALGDLCVRSKDSMVICQ